MRVLKPGGTFVSYEWCLVRSPPPHAVPRARPTPHCRPCRAAPRRRAAPAAPRPPPAPRLSALRAAAAQTDKHDPKCEAHLYSKKMIEEGDGLPDIIHTKVGPQP